MSLTPHGSRCEANCRPLVGARGCRALEGCFPVSDPSNSRDRTPGTDKLRNTPGVLLRLILGTPRPAGPCFLFCFYCGKKHIP